MEAISLKLDERMLKNIDDSLELHNYSTRTEFIRDALREKLDALQRERYLHEFLSLRGKGKPKNNLSDQEIRKLAYEELVKEKGWDL